MAITITSVSGTGGDPPTLIVVSGTVDTCEAVEVVTSCSRAPVTVDIATGGFESWQATLPNDLGCPCGSEIKVSARCTIGQDVEASGLFVLECGRQACPDDPAALFRDPFCLHAISKNITGSVRVAERARRECAGDRCETLRTSGALAGKLTSNAPCDSRVAKPLRGSIRVDDLVCAFEADATRRGIHAGTFEWQAGSGTMIKGEISGTVNAGILRGKPFEPGCEKCLAPRVLIGRLCGRVASTESAALRGASVMAVYRFLVVRGTATGLAGSFKGTLEGAILPPC